MFTSCEKLLILFKSQLPGAAVTNVGPSRLENSIFQLFIFLCCKINIYNLNKYFKKCCLAPFD